MPTIHKITHSPNNAIYFSYVPTTVALVTDPRSDLAHGIICECVPVSHRDIGDRARHILAPVHLRGVNALHAESSLLPCGRGYV
ncbi:hypothetical protein CDAR_43701 [Caerostris darwini]|uniref:Uncharacterized protein n=1 Tax=Caerostris darwini TaxID=1538125 RepID=A0AAV4WHE3_9ARAC|nr:hypothetical protein CDAR_43701 [Caerostris darwini]